MSAQEDFDYSIEPSLSPEEQATILRAHVKKAVASYFSSINSADYELEKSTRDFLKKLVNEQDESVRLLNGAYILDETLALMQKKLITSDKGFEFLYDNYTHSDLQFIVQIIEHSTKEPYPIDFSDEIGNERLNLKQEKIKSLTLEDNAGLIKILMDIYGLSESKATEKLPELRNALKQSRSGDEPSNELSNFTIDQSNVTLNLHTEEGLKKFLSITFELSNSVIKEVLPACKELIESIPQPEKNTFIEIKALFDKHIVDILNGVPVKINDQPPTERANVSSYAEEKLGGVKGKRNKRGQDLVPKQYRLSQEIANAIEDAAAEQGCSSSKLLNDLFKECPVIAKHLTK